jgi:hypothetical protein
MAKKQSGGVNVKGTKVNIGGDVVGRDKITTHYGFSDEFKKIRELIDKRPEDSNVDKDELKDTVDKIENEIKKGEEANPAKVERWLKFLASMADDIFQVTVATLASPTLGIAKAIQLIVQKGKG